MAKLFREPLLQFLLGGLILFAALTVFGGAEGEDDPYVIPVNDEALLLYLQYQDKAFDTASAQKALDAMDGDMRERLTEEYIRDEILVREALSLGLNNNDEVIRRRLIQKMDFVVEGFAPIDETIEEADLAAHFEKNTDDYQLDAEATFTHIFFSAEKHGSEEAANKASALLAELNTATVPFENSGEYGDRFYFLRNYVAKPRKLIDDHFGNETSSKIFTLTPSSTWAGPFETQYGSHLVMLRSVTPARLPSLEEVAGRIADDLRRERKEAVRKERIDELAKKYTLDRSGE